MNIDCRPCLTRSLTLACCIFLAGTSTAEQVNLLHLDELQDVTVVDRAADRAIVKSDTWAFLATQNDLVDFALSATITIDEPATKFAFFGHGWSVWPDLTYGDQGFDAGLLLRSGEHDQPPGHRGYRVQLSHKYQHVALVKYPNGGYLASVPCEVQVNQPHHVHVKMHGDTIVVSVDGKERLVYRDRFLPIIKGKVGIGSSSAAQVTFREVDLAVQVANLSNNRQVDNLPHVPNFHVAKWLGERPGLRRRRADHVAAYAAGALHQ